MAYQFLLHEKKDKVALLTLNRPDKRNALSIALRNEIDQYLAETEEDDSVSVVVVAGAGPRSAPASIGTTSSARSPPT